MRLPCQSCASQASCSYTPSTSLLHAYTAQQKPFQRRVVHSVLMGVQRRLQVRAQEREESSLWKNETRDIADRLARIAYPTCGVLLGSALLWLAGSDLAAQAADLKGNQPAFHPVSADTSNLASSEDFWSNLARYGRYYITVLLGTVYASVKPLGRLLRQPVTAFFVLVVLVGLYFFLTTTLNAMLGLSDVPIEPVQY